MKITPQSTITLYSGVDIGTEQQLAFSSKAKQAAYFASKVKKAYVNCTVVKDKIGVLKVAIKPVGQAGTGEITGVDLATCNYMSFVNPSFDNKTIYCYIVDYEYVNNETAFIYYTIDYWQTWCFDCSYHDMFIDREHLSQDSWTKVEANPYRDDIPEMVTAEPLPTPMGYEKPFYQINWWDNDKLHYNYRFDGMAMMTCMDSDPAKSLENMLSGSWNFWSVMLIQAPTDWSAFGISEESENEKKWKAFKDAVIYNNNIYLCAVDTNVFDSTNTSEWTEIANGSDLTSSIVENFQPYSSSDPNAHAIFPPLERNQNGSIKQTIHVNGTYVLRIDGTLWKDVSTSAGGRDFDVYETDRAQDGFEQIGFYSNADNKVKGELHNILGFWNTVHADSTSNYLMNNGTALGYTWSVKPRGSEIYFIDNKEQFKRLCNFYSKYQAISQIVALYGVPKWYLNHGILDNDGSLIPTIYGKLTESDNFNVLASAYRTAGTTGMSGEPGEQYAARNKKLFTSPFSYLRVIAPDGLIKEYSYEQFSNIAAGAHAFTFKIVADLSGDGPKMYLIPKKYKNKINLPTAVKSIIVSDTGVTGAGDDVEGALDFNCDEAMCVAGFPQISFNTDGYLTFLGEEYAQVRANLTSETALALDTEHFNNNYLLNFAQGMSNVVSSTAGGVANGGTVGGVVGGAGAGVDFITDLAALSYRTKATENKVQKYRESTEWMNGDLLSSDDPYIERFSKVKPAYANSIYASGREGVIRYLRGLGLFDFIVLHVQLRKEVLEYYDKWFDLYGYASGRCGIPHVVDFVKGETGAAKVPHWISVNSKNTTYLKTHDAKVEHAMLPVAQNIAQMFNNGIRFIKGDLS